MRLRLVWLGISLGGGVLVTAALLATDFLLEPPNLLIRVVFFPVALLLHLVGAGPTLGPPERGLHEWTPVHDLAVAVGIGLSWVFYSSIVIWLANFIPSRRGNRHTT